MNNSTMPDQFINEPIIEKSYRSALKWGDKNICDNPDNNLVTILIQKLNLDKSHFNNPILSGNETITYKHNPILSIKQLGNLRAIVGDENFKTDTYSLLINNFGKSIIEQFQLREKIIENLPDAVLFPENISQLEDIISYCNNEKIKIWIYSGVTSVRHNNEVFTGVICINMAKHFNKIVNFNEINQTVTVQPGINGLMLERILNNAPDTLHAKNQFTCGHFPQSFEFSTIASWVLSSSRGQNATFYGKIADMVLTQKYITPVGMFETLANPSEASGPDINQIMIGSEGIYGILTEVTLKIHRYSPKNDQFFSIMFKNKSEAINTAREIMQLQFGSPSVLRILDAEETLLQIGKLSSTLINKYLNFKESPENHRFLLLGYTSGENSFAKNVYKNILKTGKKHHGISFGTKVAKQWKQSRFSAQYLYDSLLDFNIITNTLECRTLWDNLEKLYQKVTQFIKLRPNTFCMAHLSNFSENGANWYFIYFSQYKSIQEYETFEQDIMHTILTNNGSITQIKGIENTIPQQNYFKEGNNQQNLIQHIKNYFDPKGILNPENL